MTDWFGKKHDAPVYDDGAEVPVPVGMACWYCKERIEERDDGFQIPALVDVPQFDPPEYGPANYHRWCLFRMVLGPRLSDAALRKEYGDR